MDVAIISCQECFFSRIADEHIRTFFEKMITPTGHQLDIALKGYDLKDLDFHASAAEVHRAKVQIVVITNHFLDRLRHEATARKKLAPINRVLRSKRVIAVLVSGVTAKEISEGYQAVLARFHEWFTVELRSTTKMDVEFCKKFTDQVVKIYNVELSNSSNFSVFPKKVTREQPKIVIMLKKPVQPTDTIRVDLTRGREMEVVNAVPVTNPHTIIMRIPETLCNDRTALLEITLHVNQQKLGTKLVKYENHSKSSEEDIIKRMTKAVPGFLKLLDDHISQTLSKHFQNQTDWQLDPELELLNDVLISKGDDFPTPMHFSAYYGLEQTVWTLLDEGDGLEQCTARNDVNETPMDIAGEGKIGQIIKDYQEMTVTWKAFQYVKELVYRNSEGMTLQNDIGIGGHSLNDSASASTINGDESGAGSAVTLVVGETGEGEQETNNNNSTKKNNNNTESISTDDKESELYYIQLQPTGDFEGKEVEVLNQESNHQVVNGGEQASNQNPQGNPEISATVSNVNYENAPELAQDLLSSSPTSQENKNNPAQKKYSPKITKRTIAPIHVVHHQYHNLDNENEKRWSKQFHSYHNVPGDVAGKSNPPSPKILPTYEEVEDVNPLQFPAPPGLKPKPAPSSTTVNNPRAISPIPTIQFPNYDVPRSEYKIPPPFPRPVLPQKNVPLSNTLLPTQPVLKTKDGFTTTNDYIDIVTNHDHGIVKTVSTDLGRNNLEKKSSSEDAEEKGGKKPETCAGPKPVFFNTSDMSSTSAGPSLAVLGPAPPPLLPNLDPTDEDLVDLLNDFKNNVYSRRELELLFVNWKDRPDVKLSIQERTQHLKKMREEYKRIQEQMKKNTKTSSVLDKLMKFIPGTRKKVSVQHDHPISEEDIKSTFSEPMDFRKMSGSTDRMSLESKCSTLDSSASDCEVVTERQPAVWVNAHDRKCLVGSYVSPTPALSPQNQPIAEPEEEATSNLHVSPPPRPAKKPIPTPTTLLTNGDSPPLLSKSNTTAGETSLGGKFPENTMGKDEVVPMPPPRNAVN